VNSEKLPKVIYMFWDSGWDSASWIHKECLLSWKQYNPTWKIVTLDKKNIYDYLDKDFLEETWNKKSIQVQSDIIRINLLKKYGGVWVDATTFCNKPLDEWLHNYTDSGFFVFSIPITPSREFKPQSSKRNFMISVWFIASTKKNYLTKSWCDSFNEYWKHRIYSKDYFNFHARFLSLYDHNKKIKDEFDKIPKLNSRICLLLLNSKKNTSPAMQVFRDAPTPKLIKTVNNKNIPLFKLSWDVIQKELALNNQTLRELFNKESLLQYIINNKKA